MKCLSTAETIALVLTNQVLFTLIQVCQTSSSSSKGLLLINKEEGRTAAQTAVIFQLLQFLKKKKKPIKPAYSLWIWLFMHMDLWVPVKDGEIMLRKFRRKIKNLQKNLTENSFLPTIKNDKKGYIKNTSKTKTLK